MDQLRITPTHGSEEHPGTVWGIETPHFKWVAWAVLAGLALLAAVSPRLGLLQAAPWAAAPVGIAFLYLRLFQQGKPAGYTLDLLDQLLTGGHAQPPAAQTPSPR
jgi:hypothetical protein